MLSRKGQPRNGLQPPTLRLPMGQPQPARTTAAHRGVKYSATAHQSWRYSTIDGALGRKKWINPATLVLHLSSFWKMKISWHIEPILGGLEGRFFSWTTIPVSASLTILSPVWGQHNPRNQGLANHASDIFLCPKRSTKIIRFDEILYVQYMNIYIYIYTYDSMKFTLISSPSRKPASWIVWIYIYI